MDKNIYHEQILLLTTVVSLASLRVGGAKFSAFDIHYEVLLPQGRSASIRSSLGLGVDLNKNHSVLFNLYKDHAIYDTAAKVRVYHALISSPKTRAKISFESQHQKNYLKRKSYRYESTQNVSPHVLQLLNLGVQPVYGHVEGNKNAQVFGTITDGNFAGFIHASNEILYIETRKAKLRLGLPAQGEHARNVTRDGNRFMQYRRQYVVVDVLERHFGSSYHNRWKQILPHVKKQIEELSTTVRAEKIKRLYLRRFNAKITPFQKAVSHNTMLDRRRSRGQMRSLKNVWISLLRRQRSVSAATSGGEGRNNSKHTNSNDDDTGMMLYNGENTSRKIGKNKVCRMLLIADHTYFREHAKFNLQAVISDFVWLAKEASRVYAAIDFDFDGEPDGLSFSIGEIIVYEDANVPDYPLFKRNYPRNLEGANQYLRDLSEFKLDEEFCVAYALSMVGFNGAVGMSYTGEVCNPRKSFGFLTQNYQGSETPKSMVISTFVHELGHLLGAFHDPFVEQVHPCSPGVYGDNYIMYPKAQILNYATRSVQFSPCSKNALYDSLISRNKSGCFLDGSPGIDFENYITV